MSVFGEGDGFIAVLGDDFLMVRGRGDGFITALGDDRIMVLDDGLIIAFGRGDDLITAFGRGDGLITAFGRGDRFIMVLDDDLITALRDETTGCVIDGLFLDCTRLPSGIDCASPFTGGAFPLLISTVDFSCWYGT